MKKILFKEKISYGIGAFGKDMPCAMIYTYLMLYLTDIVKLDAMSAGTILLFSKIIDAVFNPIMGFIVDNTDTKFGKFRPWILVGTIMSSIIMVFLFINPTVYGYGNISYIYCLIMCILWNFSYTIMDVPFWSMIPSFGTNSNIRDSIIIFSKFGSMLGGQIISILGLFLIGILNELFSDGWLALSIFIGISFIICEIIVFFNIKEHIKFIREKIYLKEILPILLKNDQLIVIVIITILRQIFTFFFGGFLIYYFKYCLHDEKIFSIYMMISIVAFIITCICYKKITRIWSYRTIYFISSLFIVVGAIGIYFEGENTIIGIVYISLFSIVINVGLSINQILITRMLADTVDYGEYKTGKRTESMIFSMQTLTVIVGNAIGSFLGGVTLSSIGYIPNAEQSINTILYLENVIFILIPCCILCNVIIYLKYYKLDNDYMRKIISK